MEENNNGYRSDTFFEDFFPNDISMFATTMGVLTMALSFGQKGKEFKKEVFYVGLGLVGIGLIARAIGKKRQDKESKRI